MPCFLFGFPGIFDGTLRISAPSLIEEKSSLKKKKKKSGQDIESERTSGYKWHLLGYEWELPPLQLLLPCPFFLPNPTEEAGLKKPWGLPVALA